MTKIVVNRCWGGFSLSEEACKMLGVESAYAYDADEKRADPKLIEVVEKLGREADGRFAYLEVVEIPDGIKWHIHDYDGSESIHENHRSW
jgi:hypothetical protein